MEEMIRNYIKEKNLSPFNRTRSSVKLSGNSIYKTADARAIHSKVLSKIGENFNFADSSNLIGCFPFTSALEEIERRQEFFGKIARKMKNDFLYDIKSPKQTWRPKYGIIVVTEDEKTLSELKEIGCPVKFLINDYDIQSLENYDVVQVLYCENYSRALENLPQSVFLDSVEEAYLEKYLEVLSGWSDNLKILNENKENLNESSRQIVDDLMNLTELFNEEESKVLTKDYVEKKLAEINAEVSAEIKKMTLSGDALFAMLSKNNLPDELDKVIREKITKSGLSSRIFEIKVPIVIDEEELNRIIKEQSAKEHSSISGRIKNNSNKLIKVPEKLAKLSEDLLIYDFISGISQFISDKENFPKYSDAMFIENSKNIFLEDAKAISFTLDNNYRCSILTGANSGGKTTLLEHIIQLISLYELGLAVNGNVKMPIFSEVYYFAKNKGSMNKGAFETLLTQMSAIKPGRQTLILADEIEAVTEPGVAGLIVAASANYFIEKNCFLVIATHLGKEIQKILPKNARIDGIEAKGLNEKFELIVDHNPVLGRLANSTPELIVERMANAHKDDYFVYLNDYIKNLK